MSDTQARYDVKPSGPQDALPAYIRLREALAAEDIEEIVEMFVRAKSFAETQKRAQSVEFVFNDKGRLSNMGQHHWFRPPSAKMYQAE